MSRLWIIKIYWFFSPLLTFWDILGLLGLGKGSCNNITILANLHDHAIDIKLLSELGHRHEIVRLSVIHLLFADQSSLHLTVGPVLLVRDCLVINLLKRPVVIDPRPLKMATFKREWVQAGRLMTKVVSYGGGIESRPKKVVLVLPGNPGNGYWGLVY